MQPNDRGNFYSLMTGVLELYSKKATPELMDLYFEALRPYELSDIARAMNLHAVDPDQGQFMPKPADVVRMIGGSKQNRALRAWSKLERAIREVGPYQTVVFDDPVIHAVVEDMGGWLDLCNTPTDKELEFRGNEFSKRYQGYALQGGAQDYNCKLIGMIEADCNTKGKPAPTPRLIGNADAARMTLAGGREGNKPLTLVRADVTVISGALSHSKGVA